MCGRWEVSRAGCAVCLGGGGPAPAPLPDAAPLLTDVCVWSEQLTLEEPLLGLLLSSG